MRRVYCGSTECAHDHVWENGLRFHYEPIVDFETKEQSMDPWELPIEWTDWKQKPNTASTGTHIKVNIPTKDDATPEKAFRRLALLAEISRVMKEQGYVDLPPQGLLAIAEWVAPRGL